ncbi:hypothetical protein EJ08DRAFT_673593 [Tothia fuscella]|uniref:Enoyl reductase (ER) domain-containing protein n=1 Tax=Tothia fuscella TaxID=1048955 RepID=A0A9P4NEP2_9PEZI|nr:hypothetical protein EJ08DRAFT_673593 [Tothia fuscella]
MSTMAGAFAIATQNLPAKIRCLLQPDVQSTTLELHNDLPTPTPNLAKGEHLIKVHTTSPCSGELLWAKYFPAILDGGKSLVPCYDLVGVVVAAPADLQFPAGTEIWTRTTAWRTGNAREYTIATSEELRVVITAASGGVGVIAVQLSKAAGVGEIVAVCGPKSVDFVKELGATEANSGRKADLVIDMLGGQTLVDCWKAVMNGGVLLSIHDATLESKRPEGKKDVRAEFFVMESKGWQLDELTGLIEKRQLKAVVDSIWNLNEYEKAFEILAGGHARGKVIIRV